MTDRQCVDCQDDSGCHCFQPGDKVSHKHGRVTWYGVVKSLEDNGLVRVRWGTGVSERMRPEELERDER